MITTKSGSFFESRVRVERTMEDGSMGKINETYAVNAESFTECEARVTGYVSDGGEYEVLTECRAKYREIFLSDDSNEEVFYKVRVAFITFDEASGKEKKSRIDYLVQAQSVETAKKNTDEVLGASINDYKILSVAESNIVDVIDA